MGKWDDIMELAHMLEAEHDGEQVDRSQMHDLAAKLMPKYPEIHHTLSSVLERTAQA